ncbi:hypothetical protein [Foetidibacter luteolus]|uniref:hypothetical protein n=1 Tax=Foetidibacter luteolus TaxID=2608880 RepID=UPI00129ABB05|nr:hypothetical protein [Foetidibacter luteolus]
MKKLVILLSANFLLFGFSKPVTPARAYTIKGAIISRNDNRPVNKAYIIAIAGEEESLSDVNGQFKLRTCQPLPVKISIQHNLYETSEVTVADTTKPLLVQLEKQAVK